MDLTALAWPAVAVFAIALIVWRFETALRKRFERSKIKAGPFEFGEDTSSKKESPGPRGVSINQAASIIGLMDIESRDDKDRALPPETFYTTEKISELFLSGTTCHGFLATRNKTLLDLLSAGATVKVLLLDRNSEQFRRIADATKAKPTYPKQDLEKELQSSLNEIINSGLSKFAKFEVRKTTHLAYSAMMVDGGVEGTATPKQNAQLRFQPYTEFGTPHEGVVLQVRSGAEQDIFAVYRTDIRAQWKQAVPLTFSPA